MKSLIMVLTVGAFLMASVSHAEAKGWRGIVLDFVVGVGAALFATELMADDDYPRPSAHPNVLLKANGKLIPAPGYRWKTDNPKDLRVVRK